MSTDWQPYIDAVIRWRDDPEHTIPGGDSGARFMARYDAAIARIASDGHESAVAVSHGAAMRVWCSASLGLAARLLRRPAPRQRPRRHDGG